MNDSKLNNINIFFINDSLFKVTKINGNKGIEPIIIKNMNVYNPENNGDTFELPDLIFVKLLYLEIPIEKPSAIILANPKINA